MDTTIKNVKICKIKCKYCDDFLEYTDFEDVLLEYKCLLCNKNFQRKANEKLKGRLFNIYKFSDRDNNNCMLLMRKGVYPYEYIDNQKKFNETSIPEKEDFYSQLNTEDITETDYVHVKQFVNILKYKICYQWYQMLSMLSMVSKGIIRGISYYIYSYAKADIECNKDYDKKKKVSHIYSILRCK